jgi:GPH family glycoside/pentoside/hexuronide:cation symporter
VNIPYQSLTPELTEDYHERSSLNGYRFGFAVIGTMLGAAAVQPLVAFFADKFSGGEKTGWSLSGLGLGLLMAAVTLVSFFCLKEKSRRELPSGGFFAAYRAVFGNKHYVRLITAYTLHITGITFLQSILAYYTEYVYKRPDLTPLALLLLLVTSMICIPVSVLVSKRIGKKRAYQICFIILASACLLIFFLGELLGIKFFIILMVYAGIGVGFSYVAPFAMAPDAIDYDAAMSGERREGAYYGMWTFVSKLGMALSVFVSGAVLSLGGYVPGAEQKTGALRAIKILIGPAPAIILIAALVAMEFYRLDEGMMKKLQKLKIERPIPTQRPGPCRCPPRPRNRTYR